MIQSKADIYKQYATSAILAKFAYSHPDTLSDLWFKMRDSKRDSISNVFKGVKEIPEFYSDIEYGTQGFSLVKDKILFFVFRGTNDTQDAIVDLKCYRSQLLPEDKKILVHTGFLQQFNSIKGSLEKTVEKYNGKIDSIRCIGHSLGGALATLASGHLGNIYNTKLPIVCHTFGSPRVGNYAFTKWYSTYVSFTVRCVNFQDPIPQVPFSMFYHHVSDALFISDTLVVSEIPDTKWYRRLFKFNIDCCSATFPHTCDQYIERLMKISSGKID